MDARAQLLWEIDYNIYSEAEEAQIEEYRREVKELLGAALYADMQEYEKKMGAYAFAKEEIWEFLGIGQ